VTRVDRENFGVYRISGCGKSLEAARKDVDVNAPWLSTAMLGHLAFSFLYTFSFSLYHLLLLQVLITLLSGILFFLHVSNKLAMFPNGCREWKKQGPYKQQ